MYDAFNNRKKITSSTSSSEALIKIESMPRLNIRGIGPILDKEIAIHLDNDNHLVIKEKPVNIRSIEKSKVET